MTDDPVALAEAAVEQALICVEQANTAYIEACKVLAQAKMERARSKGHPWKGLTVYRIMGGEGMKSRVERGTVEFKEFSTPDYGNPHIPPGAFYVLVDKKHAKWLDKTWDLELF